MKHKSMLRKLIFSLVLALGLGLGTAAVCSFAADYTDTQGIENNLNNGDNLANLGAAPPVHVGGINYTLNNTNHTASVAKNQSVSGDIIIPSTILYNDTTYNVTSIEKNAFQDCAGLTSVTIPNSVTTIGQNAFQGCAGLTSVTIPNSVTSIGKNAFQNCSRLTNVFLEGSNSQITEDGLHNAGIANGSNIWTYEELQDQSEAPDGKILVEITNVHKLNSQDPPPTSITSEAMGGKYIIDSVSASGVNLILKATVDDITYTYVLDENNYAEIIEVELNDKKVCNIPKKLNDKTVNAIGRYLFSSKVTLEKVTIPDSVTSIGTGAFNSCSSLTDVFVENGSSLAAQNFSDTNLQDSANIWRYEVLEDQTGAPAGKTLVKITSHDQGSETSSVDCSAMGDKYLIKEVPNGINLTHNSCGVPANTNQGTTFNTTENGIKWTCTFIDDDQNVSIRPTNQSISGTVKIPSTVTCNNYKVTSITPNAFNGSDGIKEVIIPTSVTSIGDEAFKDCTGLKSITIPDNVSSIGDGAFSKCSNLGDIYLPSSLNYNNNAGIPSTTRIWEYEVADESTINGKTIVNIVSEKGAAIPTEPEQFTIICNAMGENYVIKSIDENLSVDLHHEEGEASAEGKEATCTEIGYSAETIICAICGLPMNSEEIIPAGHNYGTPTYSWEKVENVWKCTATRVCGNDNSHTQILGTITVTGYEGTYDGAAHGLEVTNNVEGSPALEYSTDEGSTWSTTEPTRTDEGTTTVYVRVQGQTNYASATITISAKELTSSDVSLSQTSFTYNGSAQTPVITVTEGSETLTEDTDYTVSYSEANPTDAGTYTVTVEGKGNYTGTVSKQFTITKAPATAPTVVGYEGTYDGEAHRVAVTGGSGGTIVYSKDQTNWSETAPTATNVSETTVYVKVQGDSNHNDSEVVSGTITITEKAITVTAEDKSKTYGEEDPELTYQVEGLVGTDTLNGALSRESGNDVKNGGYAITQGTLTNGNNTNYTITFKQGTFTINAKALTSNDVSLSSDTFTYNGNAQTPDVTVTDGSKPLTADTDYTVSYSETNPTDAGEYTVTVEGKGNYTGTVEKTYTINYLLGDIDADGDVDVIDLQMLYNHVAEISLITDEGQLKRANIVTDGKVDVLDLQALYNIIVESLQA